MHLFIALASLLSFIFGNDEAEIVFAGDAMMHARQIETARQSDGSYDFSEYFPAITDYVKSADYAVVNLETPISTPPYSGYPMFNAPAEYVDALKRAGFDLFLTANNHTLDRRDKGLCNTIDSLDKRNVDHIGTYKSDSSRDSQLPFVIEINGIKVGFVNYTYGTNGLVPGKEVKVDYIDKNLMQKDVEKARKKGAEFIFACIHWGNEYQLLPHPSQKELADYLVGIGVDAVIGGHPHVIQPMELKEGRLVVYSLGNLISNMLTKDTRGGALVKVKIARGDDGTVKISDASYRLVFVETAEKDHNFRLKWVDDSPDPRAKAFAESARSIFNKHNINVREDLNKISK